MTVKPTPERYALGSLALHWAMLLLLIAVYASMELRELFDKGSVPREAMKSMHFMLGLLVLALVWLRIALRLVYAVPPIQPGPPAWQDLAAKLTHGGLYALMIGMPLLGWLVLSAAGKPIPFFGLELPALLGANKDLSHQLKEVHELGGSLGYVLIAVHAGASLFHHYIQRDNTLQRMLPR